MWMFMHPTHPILSFATLPNEIFCGSFWSKSLLFLCLPQQQNEFYSATNEQNIVGDWHNVLIHYANVSAPNLSGVVCCNTFKWDILWFIILIKNVVICVPSSLAKWIFFCNYMNKKVVGDWHNVLVHYVGINAISLFDVVPYNPFKCDFFAVCTHTFLF